MFFLQVPSRQALAERRQRGVGGKFLRKDEMQVVYADFLNQCLSVYCANQVGKYVHY